MRWRRMAFRAGRKFSQPGGVQTMCLTSGGALLVTGAANDGGVRVWDLNRGKLVGAPLQTLSHTVYSVAATADGSTIVTAGSGVLEVWDRQARRRVYEPLQIHGAAYDRIPLSSHAAVTPDGSSVVAVGSDGRLWFLDLLSGNPLRSPVVAHALGAGVWVTPDSGRVVTTGSEGEEGPGTLRIWDARTGRAIGEPVILESEFLSDLTFTPDGSRIVTSDLRGQIRVRLLDDPGSWVGGTPKAHGHTGVLAVAVTSDGRRVVSAGRNQVLHIWTLGEPIEAGQTVPLEMHHSLRCMVLTADGTRAIAGSAATGGLEVAGLPALPAVT